MTITEHQTTLAGETCWFWAVEFADKFGCHRQLQSPIRFSPGIPDDIMAELKQAVKELHAPTHCSLT